MRRLIGRGIKGDYFHTSRCVEMALVHDMAEAIIGDLTPECGIKVIDKHRIEEEAMEELCKLIPKERAEHLRQLFQEYNANSSNEAKLVKQVDKLEFLLQTAEYERLKGVNLEEFFKNTRHLLCEPELVELMARIDDERSLGPKEK